uniref:Uncharacterized protein n=1 Tax=Vitis vinifera TaxID=29760 RepID=A5ALP5_VITVI|nr:hypothetical protein VITISV_015616 [Vitis vinifera]
MFGVVGIRSPHSPTVNRHSLPGLPQRAIGGICCLLLRLSYRQVRPPSHRLWPWLCPRPGRAPNAAANAWPMVMISGSCDQTNFGRATSRKLDQQKIIVEVLMNYGKCRSKAMKIAAVAEGVISMVIKGAKRDLGSGFKVSAKSGTTRLSRIRLDTCCDETNTRYGIMHELG